MGIFDRLFGRRRKSTKVERTTMAPLPTNSEAIATDSESGPPADATELQMIGLWVTDPDDRDGRLGFPHPSSLTTENWEAKRRDDIVAYLRGGRSLRTYVGFATCRFENCERGNLGSDDLTDGRWAWPEGLWHYVAHHRVRLPDSFVANAASHGFKGPRSLANKRVALDDSFWLRWVAENTAPPPAQADACSVAEAQATCAELSTPLWSAAIAPECDRWRIHCAGADRAFDDFTGPISAERLRGYLFRFRLIEPQAVLDPQRASSIAKEYEPDGYAARPMAGTTDKNGLQWWAVIQSGPDKPTKSLAELDRKSIKIPEPGWVLFTEGGWKVEVMRAMDEPAWRFFLEKWRRGLNVR